MGLTPAFIEIIDSEYNKSQKGTTGKSRGLSPRINVQFNPTEYTLNKAAQIAEISVLGIDSPILQFIRGQNERLTFDLFFDTTTTRDRGMGERARDVRELTNPIYQLVKMQPETHAPPRIRFTWGAGLSFKAIVESVQQRFTLFNPDGVPLRATLSVQFREYKTLEEQLAELKLESSDHTKQRVVERGDTLNRIAAQEYGDPAQWRIIADRNASVIPNPRRLTPGTKLIIPPLDDSAR
jgi:nucleoid-associated protein YgaU